MLFSGCVSSASAVATLAAVAAEESSLQLSLHDADLSLLQLGGRNHRLGKCAVVSMFQYGGHLKKGCGYNVKYFVCRMKNMHPLKLKKNTFFSDFSSQTILIRPFHHLQKFCRNCCPVTDASNNLFVSLRTCGTLIFIQ